MKIAIGCDHIVTPIKDEVVKFLTNKGHQVIDCGTYDRVRTHYAIYGFEVARQVVSKQADLGVCICGTGVGISNSAQKTKGARVCLTRDVASAVAARKYYDANIIAMGGRISGQGLIEEIINAFINTQYNRSNKELLDKVNNKINNDNYDIHMFDGEIEKWHQGGYCEGEKQETIPLPKTWNK